MNSCLGNSNRGDCRQEQSADKSNYGALASSSTTSSDYHIIPSKGCWYGIFATNQNLFFEVNVSGLKPNVAELAQYEPSCGCWAGAFCRQLVPKEKWTLLGTTNNNSGVKPRSHCVCDGGGWWRSNQQRSSFQVVVHDEVVKASSGGSNKPQPKKGNSKMALKQASSTTVSTTTGTNSLARNIQRSVF
jgi:hypothetical protein